MELFKTISMKTLYPKNTEKDIYNTFNPPKCPMVQLFSSIANTNTVVLYKNPKYTAVLFFMMNEILLNDNIWGSTTNNYNKELHICNMTRIKYSFLKKNMNHFILDMNHSFIDLFCDIQRHYRAFARLAHIWKMKRSIVQIEHDLYMTLLQRNNRNVFSLLQHGKIYLFTAANLVNSISASLSNAPNFFVEPLLLKNPYNNIPFNKSDLYNIYFFLKESPMIMPVLFHNYFLVDFDLRKFRDENENSIRNIAIKSLIRNSPSDALYANIIKMCKKYQPKIAIDKNYPKDVLANVMRPYLFLYYTFLYSAEEYRIINASVELKYKLNRLYKYNPAFGRKIVRLKRIGFSKKMHREIEYNDKCPTFDEPMNMKKYQQMHLEIIEREYSSDDSSNDYEDDRESSDHYNEDVNPFVIVTQQPLFQFRQQDTLSWYNFPRPTIFPEENGRNNENVNEEREINDDDDDDIIIENDTDDYAGSGSDSESDTEDDRSL